ncbi:DEAD-box ATP-dependent RNA helicase 1 [Amphibalanus amphitrite]|uniref:DEAD-box ATP-dependent RNA helicase 1 n=1 Tax=Amphibalanus amphitrite TaxID=1232801 RepID=A0A6A4V9Z6_AMPAM|nr:DEAD-box ATP-dependent RNA helicase 1 [Amphibalanus amphitrite]
MDHITSAEGFSLAHLRYLVIDEANRVIEMAETGWLKAFVGRFTTPAELSESFNVVAPQPLKPLLMHNLLRQPDWRRSLVLVNWNEAAHQLELPLSVLGAREAEFPGARLMAQAGKVDGRVRETPVPLYELRQYEATYLRDSQLDWQSAAVDFLGAAAAPWDADPAGADSRAAGADSRAPAADSGSEDDFVVL